MNEEKSVWEDFRVNIGHDTSNTSQKATSSNFQPLKLFVASNLAPHIRNTNWQERLHLLNVDKYNFADLISSLNPHLSLDVTNYMDEGTKSMTFSLSFSHINSFTPQGILAQVPMLKKLVSVKGLIENVKLKAITSEEFRNALTEIGVDAEWASALFQTLIKKSTNQSSSVVTPPASSTKLDSIFDMVDIAGESEPVAEEATPEPPGAMGAFMQAMGFESNSEVNKVGADKLIQDIETRVENQLNAIMHHPAFQALEASWRGLKFLVDRIDFKKNISLQVLVCPKDQLNEALHYQVLMPAHEAIQEVPYAALLLDYDFGDEPIDLERLGDLADLGASMQTPVIVGAATQVWTEENSDGTLRVPVLAQQFQKPQFLGWSALRTAPSARYLTLAAPHFLLRPSYGKDYPVKDLAFEETTSPNGKGYLWGRAPYAVGVAMSKSYVQTGWATQFIGSGSSAKMEGLPIWNVGETNVPLEVWVPRHKYEEFMDAGMTVLASRSDSDTIFVAGARTMQKIPNYVDDEARAEARQHASLPCQIVASKLANQLLVAYQQLQVGFSEEQIQSIIASKMEESLKMEGQNLPDDAIRVEIEDSPGQENHHGIAVRVKVPARILGDELSVSMGFEFPKAP